MHWYSWVLACWGWHFDWSSACLIAPVVTTTSIVLSSKKDQNGNILVLANSGPPGKMAVKMDREMHWYFFWKLAASTKNKPETKRHRGVCIQLIPFGGLCPDWGLWRRSPVDHRLCTWTATSVECRMPDHGDHDLEALSLDLATDNSLLPVNISSLSPAMNINRLYPLSCHQLVAKIVRPVVQSWQYITCFLL